MSRKTKDSSNKKSASRTLLEACKTAGVVARFGAAFIGWWKGKFSKVAVARSGFIRDRLGKAATEIVRHNSMIDRLGARLESTFSNIGLSLEDLSNTSGNLIARTEKLNNLAAGQAQGDIKLDSAIEVVNQPLQYLDVSRKRTEELVDQLDKYVHQISRITSLQEEIRSAVGPLKHIQTLFKIESAPLAREIQQIFSGLTKDIERLHAEVVTMFDRQFCMLRETQQTITVVSGRLKASCTVQKSTADANGLRIQSALSNLQRNLERNRSQDVRISHVSKRIGDDVGELVMAMQVQDMVDQKLQHVRGVFEKMTSSIKTATSKASRAEKAGALVFVAETARLESAQIGVIQDDLVKARSQFQSGLSGITEQVKELDQGSISHAEFAPVISCTDGMVQTLLDIIDEVRGLLASTVEYTGESYESIKPIGNVASNLTSTMRELSANVHLIALNAEIQAAQLGAGTGLEVLSARTTMVSNETNRISEEVATKLDQFGEDLVGIVDSFEELFEEGKVQLAKIHEDGKAEELALHGLRDLMLQALIEVDELATSVGRKTKDVSGLLEGDILDDGTLEAAKAEMERIAMMAKECLKGEYRFAETAEQLAQVHSQYAMGSQRIVHGAVLAETVCDDFELLGLDENKGGKSSVKQPPSNRIGTVNSSLGEGIELF